MNYKEEVIVVELFPVPSKTELTCQGNRTTQFSKQPLEKGIKESVKESVKATNITLEKESIKAMNITLEKDIDKVNSNSKEDVEYILVNDLLTLINSQSLSAEELKLVLYLKGCDPLCEGIPINWVELSNKFRKSRTSLLAMKQSLVKREVIQEISQGKGRVYSYRLLPIEGWQKKEPPQRKISVDKLMDAVDNIIEFPLNKEAEEVVPSIWRSPEDSDSNRYWTTGQIYDDASGIEVVRQCETEGLIPQQVVKRAIAFSKVPQLILGTIASIADKLVNFIDKLGEEVQKQEVTTPAPQKKIIPPVQKLNTPKTSFHQGQSTTGKLQQFYTRKYEEGYFRDSWEEYLKSHHHRHNQVAVFQVDTRFGLQRLEYARRSLEELEKQWDELILPFMWGHNIHERQATLEDYFRWRNDTEG
jgi:hypothetical protein